RSQPPRPRATRAAPSEGRDPAGGDKPLSVSPRVEPAVRPVANGPAPGQHSATVVALAPCTREASMRTLAACSALPLPGPPAAPAVPTPLPIPHGVQASFSPDGKRVAYPPLSDVTRQWTHYRGGTHSRVWLLTLADSSVEQIPQPEGRCNDTDPQWLGGTVF